MPRNRGGRRPPTDAAPPPAPCSTTMTRPAMHGRRAAIGRRASRAPADPYPIRSTPHGYRRRCGPDNRYRSPPDGRPLPPVQRNPSPTSCASRRRVGAAPRRPAPCRSRCRRRPRDGAAARGSARSRPAQRTAAAVRRKQLVDFRPRSRPAPSSSIRRTPTSIWCSATARRCATASASAAKASPGRAPSASPG